MPSNREWLNGLAANDPQKLNTWFEAEHVDETNGIGGETNGIADDSPLVEPCTSEGEKVQGLPDDNVLYLLRDVAKKSDGHTLYHGVTKLMQAIGKEPEDRCETGSELAVALITLADMVERDYVRRESIEGVMDTDRELVAENIRLTAERDELQKELDIANAKLIGKPECEICDRATLLVEIEKLRDERDEAIEAYDKHMEAHDAWHEPEDIKYTRNRFSALEKAKNERIAKLESERDEWKAKVKTLADYSRYWRGRCAKLEYRSDKRAAAVERLRKMQYVDDYGDWVEAIAEVVKGTDRSNIGDYGMWESLIDLLSDENVGIPYERPRIIDPSEIEAMVANANSKAGPPQPATSIDAQQDTNGTCPDGDETCPNHSKAHSKTEPSLSQLFGILSDDCGHSTDMSGKSADCVRSEPEMSEIDEPDTIRNELEDNGYVVMPYHNGEKQAKLRGKEYDQVIFDELHDSREKLRKDIINYTMDAYNGCWLIDVDTIDEWLDRQAEITAKRLCADCTPNIAEERDYLRTRVDELNTQVQEQSELIAARGKTIESLERFMSERKLKLKKQLESKTEQCRKLKAERDEYRELYEAAMSTDYGQLSKEHEQFREEISEMLDAAQQIERIAAKHETQSN